MHEKGLQGQRGDGPLVSSQERRAAVAPRINRSLCPSIGFPEISIVRACEEFFSTVVRDALNVLEGVLAGKRVGRLLGEPTRRRPVLPDPAPPLRPTVHRPAATRTWYVRVLDETGN